MRFVCDRCKSKYSISDEKVRGKILKIRCKRCNHIIEVRDPAASRASRPAAPLAATLTPVPSRPSHASEMPEERTQISSPGLLDELRRTAANLALQPSAEPVLSEWYVAIEDEPTGPLTKEQIRGHLAAGRVGSESLVWREGFDDWRPLREAADLKDLLRGSRSLAAVAAPPRSLAAAQARRGGGSGLAEVIPIRPHADTTPAPPPRGRESQRPTLERVGVDHSPAPAPPLGGAGLGGGRVALPLRGRDVGRLGARPAAGAVALPLDAPPEGSPAQRPPLSGLRPASPPPPPQDAFAPRAASLPAVPPPPPPHEDSSLAGLVSAPPPPFDAGGVSGSGSFSLPVLDESPLVAAPDLRGPSPSLVPIVQAATAGRRRAVLVLAVAGAVLFGVVGAVVLVRVLGGQPDAAAAEGPGARDDQPLVDPRPTKGGGSNAAIKGLLAGREETDETDETGETGEIDWGDGATRPGWRPGGGGKGKTLTEEERRLIEQAKALGGGSGPVAGKAKGTGGGEGAAQRRGEPLTGAQVRTTVGKNMGSIRRCYEREMRGTKMQRDLRVLVYIRIGTSGTVRSARVRTPQVAGTTLGQCIERAIRGWAFPSATGETEVETPFVLTPGR